MEREILVANTRTQKKYKLTADVTTLAELKAVLDTKNIDYTGMSFTEGISNVQLNDDSSQLPHDVNYKGQTTNNLVIILTNTTKNIASGATSRADLVAIIKENNLGEAIKKFFGRNWTQVSTTGLQNFLNTHYKGKPAEEEIPAEEPASIKGDSPAAPDYDDILSSFGMDSCKAEEEVPEKEPVCARNFSAKQLAIESICHLLRFYYDEYVLSMSDLEALKEEMEDTLDD